jgi:hypothetical protein
MGTIDIRRRTLASPDAVRLIAAPNAELKATFPERGATHFSLSGAQEASAISSPRSSTRSNRSSIG